MAAAARSARRIAWAASRPVISGICTSIRIASNPPRSSFSSASRPFAAMVTRCPLLFEQTRHDSLVDAVASSATNTLQRARRRPRSAARHLPACRGPASPVRCTSAEKMEAAPSRRAGCIGADPAAHHGGQARKERVSPSPVPPKRRVMGAVSLGECFEKYAPDWPAAMPMPVSSHRKRRGACNASPARSSPTPRSPPSPVR